MIRSFRQPLLAMLAILTITGPIYLLMLLGFTAVRLGWFTKADMRILGQFVVRLALPAMLFRVLSQQRIEDLLDGRSMLAYASGSLMALGIGWWWGRRRGSGSYAAFVGLGCSGSNTGFIGAPILLQSWGPTAGAALAVAFTVENLLTLTVALTLAEWAHIHHTHPGSHPSRRQVLLQALRPLARHPMLWAIGIGGLFAAAGWRLPPVLGRCIDLLANASAAVALVVIGGTLVGLKLDGQRTDLAAVAVGKLLIHPLAVAASLLLLWPALGTVHWALVVIAALPMLSIYPVLAQRFQHDGFCAAALLVTTVCSFFTLSALMLALNSR